MLKKFAIGAAILVVVLLLVVSFITARFIDHKEILRATAEAKQLRAKRDSLLAEVAERDAIQLELQAQVSNLLGEADALRAQVAELELERAEQQLTVRMLRRTEDLKQSFRATFPEMAAADWGVTEVYNEEADLDIEYLIVPVGFAETFIIDHQNSESYKAQRDTCLMIDSLQTHVIALQDTIFDLERENRLAYQDGYDEAYAKYVDLNEKYIELLKNPKVSLGFPSWSTILLSTAGGVVLGTQIE